MMIGSSQALAERHDVALLDLDGVVYLAEQPIPGAAEALAQARSAGIRLAFVTNNASRTPEQVAQLLRRVGVPAEPAEVVTSAQAAAHYLADRLPAGAPVLVLGTTGLIDAVTERGLRPVFSAEENPVAVVQGFFPDLSWRVLAEAAIAIRQGAHWLATNLDATVPSPRGPLPGNGAMVAALRHATGIIPAATGKPDPAMHAESVQRSGAQHPIVVGDRLDTDIEGARRVGCASLLVLSGVTTAAMLLKAEPLHRPDFLGTDVSALLRPKPAVSSDGIRTRCGQASVWIEDRKLILDCGRGADPDRPGAEPDPSDGLDGLRALSVAAWRQLDLGRPIDRIAGADRAANSMLAEFGLVPVPATKLPNPPGEAAAASMDQPADTGNLSW